MAIVIIGDQFEPQDIVLHRRNDQLIKLQKLIDVLMPLEWQKIGLIHAQILINDKFTSNKIDDVICAEIPNADVDKEVVTEYDTWTLRKDGYPLYRRSAEDGGKLATIRMCNGDIAVDNRK
uniref:Uncharacterized protein n=1 Tax=Onchocerca volvulus TaxID=6282 RepID=A0A8R1TN08_ONCVO